MRNFFLNKQKPTQTLPINLFFLQCMKSGLLICATKPTPDNSFLPKETVGQQQWQDTFTSHWIILSFHAGKMSEVRPRRRRRRRPTGRGREPRLAENLTARPSPASSRSCADFLGPVRRGARRPSLLLWRWSRWGSLAPAWKQQHVNLLTSDTRPFFADRLRALYSCDHFIMGM